MSKIAKLFGFSGPKAPPPLPPIPKREDPSIASARKKQRSAELMRKGRRATILTRGIEDPLGATRPEARTSELLGE